MLILTRNVGQAIRISDHVVVRVLEIRDGRVKLGFEAPAAIEIWRDEIPCEDDTATAS